MVLSPAEISHYQRFQATAILLVIPGSLLVLAFILICVRCIIRNRESNLDVMGNVKPQPLDDP